MKFISIREKVISLLLKVLLPVVGLIVVGAFVASSDAINESFDLVEQKIEETLLQKGITLVTNNSFALQGMAEDNAFTSIDELVQLTVDSDQSIIFGMFMDAERMPWSVATTEDFPPQAKQNEQLNDSLSVWAHNLDASQYRKYKQNRETLIEFASPVFSEGELLGTIRYTLSTDALRKEINQSRFQIESTSYRNFVLILILVVITVLVGIRLGKIQARALTTPLASLSDSASLIAMGKYNQSIDVETNDEIGQLATVFEHMRHTVKDYAEGLEQKVKERTELLEKAQKQALENAHKAGMADVATGTLHNIGNLLNSLMTSVTVLQETLHHSKIDGMVNANRLLDENMSQIEHFFLHDPKGKNLLEYYLVVGENLAVENRQATQQIQRIKEKCVLISESVAVQQDYAKGVTSLTQSAQLSDLVEDLITLYSSSIHRHHVDIEKEFELVPPLKLSKNKVMQVLVNLYVNAKDAIDEQGAERGVITFKIYPSDNCVKMEVTDTGVGIAKEEMQKIFSYGYTTKVNGHGFGLHSCANLMTEMGGKIWASSPGKGKGTTITLAFPFATESDGGNLQS